MGPRVLTGYYRWTDIWFQWVNSLSPEHGSAIKAILAHDAIVHPDHPLHPGQQGITLYIGVLENGESRLLISSKQVDYIRYFLLATGVTETRVPLPYADCLMLESDFRFIEEKIYKTGGDLRSAPKTIEKNNRKLKGSDPSLRGRRIMFDKVRSFWKKGVWMAMDFEAWEWESSATVTEFGWCSVRWENDKELQERGHLTVRERATLTNGKYVPERRHDFAFGTSAEVPLKVFRARIHSLISALRMHGPLFLVFHDSKQDIKYLKLRDIAAPLDGLSYILPDTFPPDGLFVVDTSDLIGGLEGVGGDRRGLERTCRHLQISEAKSHLFHNAGNDAYFTMAALKAMAEGGDIETQRERRWPDQLEQGSGTKVIFREHQEESDCSDLEGIMPA